MSKNSITIEKIFQTIRVKDLELFFKLIENSSLDEVNEYGQNFLQEAISSNNIIVIKYLLDRKININHQDNQGKTALHYCAEYFDIEASKLILAVDGTDLSIVDKFGNNPLWTAVFNARGEYDLVELFKQYKADSNNKNNVGKTPLDFAKQIEDEELINILSR